MAYEKYYNEQEKEDIDMFLKNVDELHHLHGKNIKSFTILEYIVSLLKECSDVVIGSKIDSTIKRLKSRYEPQDVLVYSDQLMRFTEEIATKIACNAINDVDSHNTTLSVLSILQDFSWETKAVITIASYILTYGGNGLNLCIGSKFVVANELRNYIQYLLEAYRMFSVFDWIPEWVWKAENNPLAVKFKKNLMVAVYSIVRVVVVAASSHLLARSSRDGKFVASGSTIWCSKDLKFIYDQLNTIRDQINEVINDEEKNREQEDEQQLKYKIILRGDRGVEDINVKVVGDQLLVQLRGSTIFTRQLGKNIRKEDITAVYKDYRLYITVPKLKISDPESLHIPVTTA